MEKLLIPIVSLILFSGVFVSFQKAKNRPGEIVLPGGITYLGPSPTHTQLKTLIGQMYPYSFTYPANLSLGFFPNDPTDGVTIFKDGTDAGANLFFRVEPCKESPCEAREHASSWWKQYNWKGLKTLTDFTNSTGLKGYRAVYIATDGTTPYEHVFFEIPNIDDKIIWISGKLFTKEVFDKLVDSMEWKK